VTERGERRVGHRTGARRPGPRVEQRELAEHLAGTQHTQQVLPAVDRRPGELDLAVEHDVEAISVLSLKKEVLAASQLDL
jgi:hypothetical protein